MTSPAPFNIFFDVFLHGPTDQVEELAPRFEKALNDLLGASPRIDGGLGLPAKFEVSEKWPSMADVEEGILMRASMLFNAQEDHQFTFNRLTRALRVFDGSPVAAVALAFTDGFNKVQVTTQSLDRTNYCFQIPIDPSDIGLEGETCPNHALERCVPESSRFFQTAIEDSLSGKEFVQVLDRAKVAARASDEAARLESTLPNPSDEPGVSLLSSSPRPPRPARF